MKNQQSRTIIVNMVCKFQTNSAMIYLPDLKIQRSCYTGRQCSIHDRSYFPVSLTVSVYLCQLNRNRERFVRQHTTANTNTIFVFAVKTCMFAYTTISLKPTTVSLYQPFRLQRITSVSKTITGTQITWILTCLSSQPRVNVSCSSTNVVCRKQIWNKISYVLANVYLLTQNHNVYESKRVHQVRYLYNKLFP